MTCFLLMYFLIFPPRIHNLQARKGLELLRQAGTEKMNFAGGEPFLHKRFLGELTKICHELGMSVSIISNGSLITPEWMDQYGKYVDIIGVSVDSFDPLTNALIGRGGDANNQHVQRVLDVASMCDKYDISFKMNTVVCTLNWKEDMSDFVHKINPKRWKVFQVLVLEDENSGGLGELRDARPYQISNDQFMSFVERHKRGFPQLIAEPNDLMQNSYLLLDERMCFLDSSSGGKKPSESILDVGVERVSAQSSFDFEKFQERCDIFEWTRERGSKCSSDDIGNSG